MAALQTGGLVSALQGLDVKPDLIAAIVSKFTAMGDDLGAGFEVAQLTPSEFGNRPSAESLGTHYSMAFDVMQATIDGIAKDLLAFGESAKVAATYVDTADQGSAADFAQAQASVDQLAYIAEHSNSDRAYDDARNAQGNGSRPTPTSTDGS